MDQRKLIVQLEHPLSVHAVDPVKVREILVAGLSWSMPDWPELAVRWIEEGAPIDAGLCELLRAVATNKSFPQNVRHRAKACVRRHLRGETNAWPLAQPRSRRSLDTSKLRFAVPVNVKS
jgi:hypothetical protein